MTQRNRILAEVIMLVVIILLLGYCGHKEYTKIESKKVVQDSIQLIQNNNHKALESLGEIIVEEKQALIKSRAELNEGLAKLNRDKESLRIEQLVLKNQKLNFSKLSKQERVALNDKRKQLDDYALQLCRDDEALDQMRDEIIEKEIRISKKEEAQRAQERIAKLTADSVKKSIEYVVEQKWRVKVGAGANVYKNLQNEIHPSIGWTVGVDYKFASFLRGTFDYNLQQVEGLLIHQFGLGIEAFQDLGKVNPYIGASFITALTSGEMEASLRHKEAWIHTKAGVEIPVNDKFTLYVEGQFTPARFGLNETVVENSQDWSRTINRDYSANQYGLFVGLKIRLGK